MFIELTDHLRCPIDHDGPDYLVLLPDTVDGRQVRSGALGCTSCHRVYRIEDGVFDTGDAIAPPTDGAAVDASAIAALTGLGGPGGYLVLVGTAASEWRKVSVDIPGVGLVAVNPDASVTDEQGISVVRSARIPLASSSMRGVVLGPGYADDPWWVSESLRVTLPGLRIVGVGEVPRTEELEILASAAGCWVAAKRRNAMA